MAASPPSFSPGRPASDKDWLQFTNGDPGTYLGALVSAGTTSPVNNVTTATPFNIGRQDGNGVWQVRDSLAGRVLLLQPTAAGVFLTSPTGIMTVNVAPAVVALQTVPPAAGRSPGVLLQANERVIVCMLPTNGWLQWLGNAGAANLFVWELV